MVGYRDMPSWWTTRYGASPYTSDNLILWTDLSEGYDYNNGDPVIIPWAVRPELLKVIPVDSLGNLLSPFDAIIGNYISLVIFHCNNSSNNYSSSNSNNNSSDVSTKDEGMSVFHALGKILNAALGIYIYIYIYI